MKKCPRCESKLEANISPCTDMECCGIEHSIRCSAQGCYYTHYETFSYEDLEETWVKMGGKIKDIE